MPVLHSLDHLVLTVRDVAVTVAFYERALGMIAEPFTVADGSTRTALRFGTMKINLHPIATPFRPHARAPTSGSADLCFLTDQHPDVWIAHLDAVSVPIVDGPVRRTGASGPILSIYVRDPDGNLIEIALPEPPGNESRPAR